MASATVQQNTNTLFDQIKSFVAAPSIPNLLAKYDLQNYVVPGLFIAAGTVAIVIIYRLSVLSRRKGALLIDAKDRQLALALKEKDEQIERIKQEKDEQIEQITNKALADKRDSDDRIALAEVSAALANQRAAEIEKENLELKLANRRISEKQHKILVDILSKKTGQVVIETMGDPESGLFAEDIVKVFTDSKWEIGGKLLPQGVVWTGLMVYKSSGSDAATVLQALKAAKIPFSVRSETRDKATIMVGGNPSLF